MQRVILMVGFQPGPDVAGYGKLLKEVRMLTKDEGRKPGEITAALYLTIAIDRDPELANKRIDEYLYSYYHARPDILKKRQACFGGTVQGAVEWLQQYIEQGRNISFFDLLEIMKITWRD